MAGPNPFVAFTGTSGFACDFLPYRSSNAYFRTLAATTPEDWGNNAALTAKADDTSRWVEIAASQRATWLPSITNAANVEVLACFLMRVGQYTRPTLSPTIGYEARLDTAAGLVGLYESGTLVASAVLPASVWTSSSVFVDCWVRVHLQATDRWTGAKVWSTTEAEPNAYTVIYNPTGGVGPAVVSTDPPGIGSASVAVVSACRWFSYGVASPAPTPRVSSDATYYDTWFKTASTGAPRMLAAEIYIPGWNGASAATYTTAVLRVATEGYAGGAAWPFTNQMFAEGIIGWPKFSRVLPDTIFGRQSFTVGDLLIANPLSATGGLRDDWLRAKLTNAVITLRYGNAAWPWYDLATLFTGTVMEVSEEPGVIRLKLRDATGRFDRNVHRTTLTTSNAANGLPTPISVGTVFNASPVQTDSANLVYRVGESNVGAVTVRDRGVVLNTTTVTAVAFDAATETAQTLTPHALAVNDPVTLAGRLPSPLAAGLYYVQSVPATDKLTFASTLGGAVINLTQGDPGNSAVTVWPSTNTIRTATLHGRVASDIVRVVPAAGTTLTAGLTENTNFFVIATGLTVAELKLSLTLGGAAVTLGGNTQLIYAGHSINDEIEFADPHGLAVNDCVRFAAPTLTNIVAGTDYYVLSVPSTRRITISATLGGARLDFVGIGAFSTITAVNTGTGVITLSAGAAYVIGDQFDMDGTPPAPLVAGDTYFVKTKPATDDITVCATPTGPAITLTSAATGSNTRRYTVGGTIEKPVPSFRLTSYAGTLTVDQVITDLTAATFKLRQNPAGQITCDITGQKFNGASGTSGYHALGVVIGQRDPIVSVDANHPLGLQRSVGLWLTQPTNLLDVIDLLASSVTCIWGQNRLGTLTFYVAGSAFTAGTVGVIGPDDVLATGQMQLINKKLPVAYNDGVRVGHTKNFTTQNDSDLAGAVTAANRAIYAAEYTIKVINAGATPAVTLDDAMKGELRKVPMLQTCVVSDTDAQWVGQTKLVASPKGLATLNVTVRWAKLDPYRLGVATLVKLARYGIDTNVGQTMVVIGIEEDVSNHSAKLTLLCELPGYYPVTT